MASNESTRKWKDDKRSWIFYRKQIKNYPNIISDEVEGNVFMFDCETARLSIWSQKWETFTEVGVSGLINQVERNNMLGKQELFRGTRIYYKGIELQNKCIERDAGILEFIDIKYELERSYINISRKGFTEAGERFFEEQLYPGLLEAIHKVLQFLEEKDIVEKFCGVLKEKCKNGVSKFEIVHLVVSVSVLAYYAMRTEWDITEKISYLHNPCESKWNMLLSEIDKILKENEKILSDLSDSTSFFNLNAYNVGYIGQNKEEQRQDVRQYNYNFLQIFLAENHWAIVQERKESYDEWVSYLVMIEGKDQPVSREYRKITSLPHLQEDDEELERWGDILCMVNSNYLNSGNSGQQLILNWMLRNLPTVGLFTNKSGSIRANILSNRIYPSIYMNKNFKNLLIHKMMDKAASDGIQRFSMITWQKREFLGCSKLPYNIFFVKKGYLSDYSCHRTIVPFDGKLLIELKSALEASEKNETINRIALALDYLVIENILLQIVSTGEKEDEVREYMLGISWGVLMNIASYVQDIMAGKITEMKFIPNCTIESLVESLPTLIKEWEQIYWDVARAYMKDNPIPTEDPKSTRNLMAVADEIKEKTEFISLCNLWIYCCLNSNMILQQISMVDICFRDYLKRNSDYTKRKQNVINYMEEKIAYQIDKERLKEYYESYEKELVQLVMDMEQGILQQKISSIQDQYSMMIYNLQQTRQDTKEI